MPASSVLIVDNDRVFCDSLRWALEGAGLHVRTALSAHELVDSPAVAKAGCVVLDVRMPDVDGMEVLRRRREFGIVVPVIVISAYADIPMAVQATRLGAFEFFAKPVEVAVLLDAIDRALAAPAAPLQSAGISADVASLTLRERQILALVAQGKPNKVIADEIGISAKTVEAHRGKGMRKLGLRSPVELVPLLDALGEPRKTFRSRRPASRAD